MRLQRDVFIDEVCKALKVEMPLTCLLLLLGNLSLTLLCVLPNAGANGFVYLHQGKC